MPFRNCLPTLRLRLARSFVRSTNTFPNFIFQTSLIFFFYIYLLFLSFVRYFDYTFSRSMIYAAIRSQQLIIYWRFCFLGFAKPMFTSCVFVSMIITVVYLFVSKCAFQNNSKQIKWNGMKWIEQTRKKKNESPWNLCAIQCFVYDFGYQGNFVNIRHPHTP